MWRINESEENLGSILILVAFGMLVGVVLSFCISDITAPSEEQVSIQEEEEMEVIGQYNTDGLWWLYKIHDNRDNVTCWVYRGRQEGGISCIPDHMLTP